MMTNMMRKRRVKIITDIKWGNTFLEKSGANPGFFRCISPMKGYSEGALFLHL